LGLGGAGEVQAGTIQRSGFSLLYHSFACYCRGRGWWAERGEKWDGGGENRRALSDDGYLKDSVFISRRSIHQRNGLFAKFEKQALPQREVRWVLFVQVVSPAVDPVKDSTDKISTT
jgi:hypothetical protein